jgi:geranylgeranyl pyrophosphate synthase
MKQYNNIISVDTLFCDHEFELLDQPLKTDLEVTFFKGEKKLIDKLNSFKQIEKKNLLEYLNKRVGCIVELAVSLGWIIGGGSKKELKKTKKMVKHLMMIYKLAHDFTQIHQDMNKHEKYTTNLVINWGIMESFNLFLTNKEKFIETAMILDIYSTTINEIVTFFQKRVDEVMEESSPELKSSHSTIMTGTSMFN